MKKVSPTHVTHTGSYHWAHQRALPSDIVFRSNFRISPEYVTCNIYYIFCPPEQDSNAKIHYLFTKGAITHTDCEY